MKIPINVPVIEKEEINEVRDVLLEKSLTTAGIFRRQESSRI
ncbi:hypothetical protein DYY67_1817 [Candidatus Nitrosotalea sp. TS]|nr:hypothetical protein [Candidatus Nitrosotalea sp. TS]NHI02741.1 hypothetical protein [Candidatus Nitrosotalea sp. TS]